MKGVRARGLKRIIEEVGFDKLPGNALRTKMEHNLWLEELLKRVHNGTKEQPFIFNGRKYWKEGKSVLYEKIEL